MNIDNIPILMVFFWQGFSLAYVVLTWLQRFSRQFEQTNAKEMNVLLVKVSYPLRFFLSILGMIGALGMAGLVGTFSKQFVGSNIALLIGFGIGILVAYLLSRRVH